jgi:hypothetical protein
MQSGPARLSGANLRCKAWRHALALLLLLGGFAYFGSVFDGPSRALGYALSATLRRDPSGLQGLAPSAPRDDPNARAATGSCECYDAVVERDGRAVNEVRLVPWQSPVRTGLPTMKVWERRKTLAETEGGAAEKGGAAVGLTGSIPVVFSQGENKLETMASPGDPLKDVAAQAGQYIKYKCGKGECGTCQVRVNGEWVKTCVSRVPAYVEGGGNFDVWVRPSMAKSKKASSFFSVRSFFDGFKNNLLGMVGFAVQGKKSKQVFNERMQREADLKAAVAAKKLAKKGLEIPAKTSPGGKAKTR